MLFCVLGTFINNIAFITIKDLPGVKASTYNVLLGHIVLGRQLVRKAVRKWKVTLWILAIGLLIHILRKLRYIVCISPPTHPSGPPGFHYWWCLLSVNLLVCTVVKPFSAVYIAYAHATVGHYDNWYSELSGDILLYIRCKNPLGSLIWIFCLLQSQPFNLETVVFKTRLLHTFTFNHI